MDFRAELLAALNPPAAKPSGRRRHKHKPENEGLCKYASKPCFMPRVVKKTGELHRYCDHHREQANRNQRRLEQRRRLKEKAESATSSPSNSTNWTRSSSSDDSESDDPLESHNSRTEEQPSCTLFEPFREPVALREEDVSSLQYIFAEPSASPQITEESFVLHL